MSIPAQFAMTEQTNETMKRRHDTSYLCLVGVWFLFSLPFGFWGLSLIIHLPLIFGYGLAGPYVTYMVFSAAFSSVLFVVGMIFLLKNQLSQLSLIISTFAFLAISGWHAYVFAQICASC